VARYTLMINKLQEMDTIEQMHEFINSLALELALRNYEKTSRKHNALISRILKYVNENLGNPELSLSWLAKEALYMNVDYLGKLFYKEINEKFSQYVLRIRMEEAKKIIANETDIKVYEIAEKVGFGDNSQYFSQVFKKYTGLTPKEFKNSF
jgi:two-component system response regulator YesN